jgi:hypothetical protein
MLVNMKSRLLLRVEPAATSARSSQISTIRFIVGRPSAALCQIGQNFGPLVSWAADLTFVHNPDLCHHTAPHSASVAR